MRVFAIESYAAFGGMVISVALLGFGVSGTLLTVFREFILSRRDRWLFWTALLLGPCMIAMRFCQQAIPFVPGKMLGEPSHAWWIAGFYATAFVPLFVAGMYIGVTLVGFTRDVHRLYFADLAASGVAAFLTLGLLYVVPPEWLILIPVVPAAVAAFLLAQNLRGRSLAVAAIVASVLVLSIWGQVRFNEFKGILGTLRTVDVSGAHVIAERSGPMGYIQIVESRSERSAPGLSAATPMGVSPPAQHALFVDGEKVASLGKQLQPAQQSYLDWMISALPYQLLKEPRVLIPVAAGGEAVMEAFHHHAQHVVAGLGNPQLKDLWEQFSSYNGNLLKRSDLTLEIGSGRGVVERLEEKVDLVMLRGLDASGLSVASAPGMSESYLLTQEAFESFITALKPGGLVAVTMRLSVPAWKAVRLLPTVVGALRTLGVDSPEDRVIFVRDTFVGLCIVSPDGFSAEQRAKIRTWTRKKSFDLSHLSDLKEEEINQFTVLLEEIYSRTARALFESADKGAKFLDDYFFDISATNDNRPYFSHVVKAGTSAGLQDYQRRSVESLASIPNILGLEGGGGDIPDMDAMGDVPMDGNDSTVQVPEPDAEAELDPDSDTGFIAGLRHIPVELWGGYMQWATLSQGTLFALLIILIPFFGARRDFKKASMKGRTLLYFACLGTAFMLAEMVMIRKLTLLLANPLLSVSVVLSVILVCSGLGSYFAGGSSWTRPKIVRVASWSIALALLLWAGPINSFIASMLGWPLAFRFGLAVLFVGPVAFFMGMLFPTGLAELDTHEHGSQLVPWAWAINGATSVVAAVGCDLLNIHFGFAVVLILSALIYLLAWLTFPQQGRTAAKA
ncbi:MAG TPA: hypothetical protein EYN06_08740 [Myxococcales bacterium]|nr:hypothetical protein [Myxococcales bacterium]